VRSTSSGAVIGALRQLRDRRRAEFPHAPGGTIDGVGIRRRWRSFGYLTIIWRRQKSRQFRGLAVAERRARRRIHRPIAGSTPNGQFSRDLAGNPDDRFTVKFINNDLSIRLPIRSSLNQFYQNPFQQGCATARPPRRLWDSDAVQQRLNTAAGTTRDAVQPGSAAMTGGPLSADAGA